MAVLGSRPIHCVRSCERNTAPWYVSGSDEHGYEPLTVPSGEAISLAKLRCSRAADCLDVMKLMSGKCVILGSMQTDDNSLPIIQGQGAPWLALLGAKALWGAVLLDLWGRRLSHYRTPGWTARGNREERLARRKREADLGNLSDEKEVSGEDTT